ncbi:MAG: DUF481 domain-containing protein [Ignavibacteria bacterium]
MTFRLLMLIAFIILISDKAHSQRSDQESDWSGKVVSEGSYQSGNVNKFFVLGRGDIKRATQDLELILAAGISYGESKNKKDDNSLTAAFTTDLFYKKMISPFVLQYVEYNFAKGIDIRSQSGGGLKYLFWQNPLHRSSISLALIYDYTDLTDKPGNYNTGKMRLSLRLRTKQSLLDSNFVLSFTGFYQPSISDLSAANLRAETNLDIPITKMVFARIAYLYSFEDVVSVGRVRLDNKLTFGLGIGFD